MINEELLAKVLQDKAIGYAGRGVHGHEPLAMDHPLITLDNPR